MPSLPFASPVIKPLFCTGAVVLVRLYVGPPRGPKRRRQPQDSKGSALETSATCVLWPRGLAGGGDLLKFVGDISTKMTLSFLLASFLSGI